MKIVPLNLETLPLDSLKKGITGRKIIREYEFEFVRRITLKDASALSTLKARDYFLTDFSYPFLEYIAVSICKEDSARKIQGEYYEFISLKDKKTETPYYRLSLYKGITDVSLRSYVSIITTRYFIFKCNKAKEIEDKFVSIDAYNASRVNFSGSEVIENPWFDILISQEVENKENDLCKLLKKAMDRLPERERLILKLMVMGDATALEAFEDMEPYIAETAKSSTSLWTDKQKQDAMSLLKGRALIHIQKIWKTL